MPARQQLPLEAAGPGAGRPAAHLPGRDHAILIPADGPHKGRELHGGAHFVAPGGGEVGAHDAHIHLDHVGPGLAASGPRELSQFRGQLSVAQVQEPAVWPIVRRHLAGNEEAGRSR
jgi:hypothetical protein